MIRGIQVKNLQRWNVYLTSNILDSVWRVKFEMESRIDVVFPSECLQYKAESKQLKQKYKKKVTLW